MLSLESEYKDIIYFYKCKNKVQERQCDDVMMG